MAVVGAAAAVVGVGVALSSSNRAAREAEKAGEISEQLAKADEAVAKIFTADQIKQRRETLNQEISTAAARYAAGGVDIAEGSPLLVQADILRIGLEDIEALVTNGELDAYRARLGGRFSKTEASSTAAAARAQGVSAVATGINQLSTNPFVINAFTPTPTTTTGAIT